MTKYVSDTKAGKAISAYIVLTKKGEHVATVRAHYSDGGNCLVNVHDNKAGFQSARAGGYGYDKFNAALSGLTIDGHAMSDHCGERIKPPKGAPCFPATYKARKGYTLANYGTWERNAETGTWERRDSYYWRDMAVEAWRKANGSDATAFPQGEDWEQVQRDARRLTREAEESGRTASGYADCYREAGLKYITAIGYRVIQAV